MYGCFRNSPCNHISNLELFISHFSAHRIKCDPQGSLHLVLASFPPTPPPTHMGSSCFIFVMSAFAHAASFARSDFSLIPLCPENSNCPSRSFLKSSLRGTSQMQMCYSLHKYFLGAMNALQPETIQNMLINKQGMFITH